MLFTRFLVHNSSAICFASIAIQGSYSVPRFAQLIDCLHNPHTRWSHPDIFTITTWKCCGRNHKSVLFLSMNDFYTLQKGQTIASRLLTRLTRCVFDVNSWTFVSAPAACHSWNCWQETWSWIACGKMRLINNFLS